MNWKFISIMILIIILIIYIIFYPLQFEFYEDLKAKRIAEFIVIPIFSLSILYDLFRNLKKGEKNWRKYSINLVKGLGVFAVIYFLILRSFFSGGILFINTVFGVKEIVKVSGIITEKTNVKGGGRFIGKYELIVDQNGNEFVFDSNRKSIENYEVNGHFEMEMKKGILNLIYK
ncbi:MAG: hypothetical protein NWQ09_10890 [Nonlabens sp.]|nr:hypothetical protein [Nonlabens sp.]